MTNPTTEYGLLISRYFKHSTEYVAAKLVRREAGASHPLNCTRDNYDLPKHLEGTYLDGLGMCGFVTDSKDPAYIGYEPEYRDVFSVDRRTAMRMVKTLTRINNRLNKDEVHEAGDVLMSLCAALKLSFVVKQTGKAAGWSYEDADWTFMTLAQGRNAFRHMIDEAIAEVVKRKAA